MREAILYIYKNFVILTDFIMDRSSIMFQTHQSFVKLKRLISKRKSYFDLSPNMDYKERSLIILENIENFRSLIKSAFKDYKFLLNLFEKVEDLIDNLRTDDEQISQIAKLLSKNGVFIKGYNHKPQSLDIKVNTKSGGFYDFSEKLKKIWFLQRQLKDTEIHETSHEPI